MAAPRTHEQDHDPVQPVDEPILCSPYKEPDAYWLYHTENTSIPPEKKPGRRPAGYFFTTERTQGTQLALPTEAEPQREELSLVNRLREGVRAWREKNYRGATQVTRALLMHWRAMREDDRRALRRPFFCQTEAVETVIYLAEIHLKWSTKKYVPADPLTPSDLASLRDRPSPDVEGLLRMGCKMATGSGKTVVMAMLIAWALCNRAREGSESKFPSAVLVVCPGHTVRERLAVLLPEHPRNYYDLFELIPRKYRDDLRPGLVKVINWHQLAEEGEHVEGGKSYAVVQKGPESDETFAERVLKGLPSDGPVLVLNDEAHHAWRPAPSKERLSQEEKEVAESERRTATVWVHGLERLARGRGLAFCADLSATPFYIAGSGHIPGSAFPWLVSDFGLTDAIESGIVKIPRLPTRDTTGRREAKFYRLWENVMAELGPGEKLRGGKPKPEALWTHAHDALLTLASDWAREFGEVVTRPDAVPPVLILVCDNTQIADYFYARISGESEVKEDGKRRKVYGTGEVFPELLSNTPTQRHTLLIHNEALDEADRSEDDSEDAETLRKIVATVGQKGQAGQHVRCVVSVSMLTEGWDATNVTHILGLRAFGSQLLCEQVVGRGLRRRHFEFEVDPKKPGLLKADHVDVYGVPFTMIPFRAKPTGKPEEPEPQVTRVQARAERAALRMRFPAVEGFAFALDRFRVRADVSKIEPLRMRPERYPTATFVQPAGVGAPLVEDRTAYYESTHPQTIEFEIARQVVERLMTERDRERAARHLLFPQVLRVVKRFVQERVEYNGCDPRELGLSAYMTEAVERLVAAIEPDVAEGEAPILPVLNRSRGVLTTDGVSFETTRPCFPTQRSHLDYVVADTETWEQSAAFRLETSDVVECYVKNDEHVGLVINYELLKVQHRYLPDFLVRLTNGLNVLLEVKGQLRYDTDAKHQAARRWADAVSCWGRCGRWVHHVNRNPQTLGEELKVLGREPGGVDEVYVVIPREDAETSVPATPPESPDRALGAIERILGRLRERAEVERRDATEPRREAVAVREGARPRVGATVLPALGVLLVEGDLSALGPLQNDPDVSVMVASSSIPVTVPDVQEVPADLTDTWHLDQLAVREAHEKHTRGRGRRIGIVDSGILSSHAEFTNKAIVYRAFDDRGRPIAGATCTDVIGHGTHVAGIAAGQSVGVAPEAELVVANVFPHGSCNDLVPVLGALNWLLDLSRGERRHGIDVVNLSLQVYTPRNSASARQLCTVLAVPLQRFRERGIEVVASIGNRGPGSLASPGNFPDVLGVGAVDREGVPWPENCSGRVTPSSSEKPDLLAPGVDVLSAWINDNYVRLTGTSMAAASVSGLVVLLLDEVSPSRDLRSELLQRARDLRARY
jgi:type III restriction enzyme